MKNLRANISWIFLQGLFLPLVILFYRLLDGGQIPKALVVFVAYEVLVYLDAILFIRLFRKK